MVRITVEPYPYPISYKGQHFYRAGSTKQELKGAALDRFLLGKTGKRWDSVPLPGISVKTWIPGCSSVSANERLFSCSTRIPNAISPGPP